MKLQKIISRLQKLHPKKIDLSLYRVKKLCSKLGNPQNKINCISVIGTNGKYSTIQALFSILKEANYKCNVYTSPHIRKINERFIFNNKQISDNELVLLLEEIEEINNSQPITFFEILTAAFLFKSSKYPKNINLIETGLFHRFDATNILKKNLGNVITSIGLDHLDWLPKNKKTVKKIVFEKTSCLLNSKTIIAKQNSSKIKDYIKKNITKNKSPKLFYGEDFSYLIKNDKFIFKDRFGKLNLPIPNLKADFQLENISTAIATLRVLKNLNIDKNHIKKGIIKIDNIARFQEIKSGKLKNLVKDNSIFIDGSHNPLGAKTLTKHLQNFKCNKHIIFGMMTNKNHHNFIKYFKNFSSLTAIDIPNQPNAIKGIDLKNKLKNISKIKNKNTVEDAIKSLSLKKNDLIIITGSLYLAGEILNLN